MNNTINISKLDKAEVLAALYNASRPIGLGALNPTRRAPMTAEQAQGYINESTRFDYLNGRVMKVNLKEDDLFVGLYDRDNGSGAAERALTPLLAAIAKAEVAK